jgi:hypothetical protein
MRHGRNLKSLLISFFYCTSLSYCLFSLFHVVVRYSCWHLIYPFSPNKNWIVWWKVFFLWLLYDTVFIGNSGHSSLFCGMCLWLLRCILILSDLDTTREHTYLVSLSVHNSTWVQSRDCTANLIDCWCLVTGWWENVLNRVQGEFLREGTGKIFGTGCRENVWEQGTGRIYEKMVQGECLRIGYRKNGWEQCTGRIFENRVVGKYLRKGYRENIWNRVLGGYLRRGY